MMSYYLLENRPRITQFRSVRRNGAVPSGVVVLHTAENATDTIGADAGAEAVARFIRDRSNAGSYHVLCDSDSTIHMVPWAYEAWHDTRTNNHSVGISGAVSCADWRRLGARGDRIVVRMALAAREYAAWLHKTRGVTIPARRITRTQALAGVPGFIGHGEIDTERRSDPGRDFNWPLFLSVYATPTLAAQHGVIGGTVPTIPGVDTPEPLDPIEETDMPASVAVRHPNGSIALAGDDGTFIPLGTEREVEALKATGALRLHDGPLGTLQLPDGLIWDLRARIGFRKATQGEQDPAKVAATITATLVPAVLDALPASAGLTVEQVQTAAEAAIRNVLRSV